MSDLFRRDLPAFLGAPFGELVTFAGAPDRLLGIIGMHDVQTLGDDGRGVVIGRQRGVTLPTWAADQLAIGQSITFRRKNHNVTSIEAEPPDGLLSVVLVRDAI